MWQEKLDEIESVCSALEPAAYNFGAMAISESKCDVPEALRFFREMILVGWDHLTAQIITVRIDSLKKR